MSRIAMLNVQPACVGSASLTLLVVALSLTLTGCVETLPKLPAIAQIGAAASDLQGTWSGSYHCAQGATAVRLHLQATGAQTLSGRYDFGSLPGQSNVPIGSFAVTGSTQLGRLDLTPGAWIQRAAGYETVRVAANYVKNPDRLIGNVAGPGCGAFEVTRESSVNLATTATGVAGAAAPTGTSAPSRPQAPARSSTLPPWRGDWIGTMECSNGPVRMQLTLMRPHQAPLFSVMGTIMSIGGKKPAVGSNMFSMIGEVDGNSLRVRWKGWIGRPLTDKALNLDGEYAAADESLAMKPTDGVCKAFAMRRPTLDDLSQVPKPATPSTSAKSAAAPASAPPTSPPVKQPADSAAISFSTFMTRLGEKGKSPQRLVGTSLRLKLQPGAIAGAEGFVQDPSILVLFQCPAGSRFNGGDVSAKITRVRDNDDGLFVSLDRCGA